MFFKKFIIFVTALTFQINTVYANEIKNLASINNSLITSYDLYLEIKLKEEIEGLKIEKKYHSIILQQLINDKIKELEVKEKKIQVDLKQIDLQTQSILNKVADKNISPVLIKKLKNKIKINTSWNRLVISIYRNKLEINMNEIDEILKSKKVKLEEKDNFVLSEKNKKLNIFSKTHFNEIKKKYFIKNF